MSGPGTRLPYPGLRSFRREETELFFGRESSVNDMISKLADGRFLAVLGASGSGKSSLVRTGLFDGLELGLLTGKTWWRIADTRPGGAPMRNLAIALIGDTPPEGEVSAMRAFLSRGPRAIAEWCADGHLAPGENLLILVDQFEELFRYQHYEGRQEAEAFVALLLESARDPDIPVYVVITMRSEFLGACALIGGLAEAMNRGQYLTPRMDRAQCREAIEGPARVCGFEIKPALTNRLLNDLADFAPWDEENVRGLEQTSQLERMARRADQLPLLQHALNRLWIRASAKGGPISLELADYETLGGLRGALDGHAREILDSLGQGGAKTAEAVFRALTVGTSIADAVRRPTRFSDLVAISGALEKDVRAVCDAFRAQGCNFLTPFAPASLDGDTIVDISHESLIRQWSDLSKWLEKEAQDADSMRRLGTAAARAGSGKGDLLYGRDLTNLADWRDDAKLTEAWANRYVEDPHAAFGFLDKSLDEDASRKTWEWRKKAALWLVGVILPVLVLAIVFINNKNNSLEQLNTNLQTTVKQRDQAQSELNEKIVQLGEAERELRKSQQETIETIQGYIGQKADELQRAGEFGKAGDLLASLVAKTRGKDMKPDERVLKYFAPRFAWQAAGVRSGVTLADEARPLGERMNFIAAEADIYAPKAYALWRDKDDKTIIRVIERRTGRVMHRFVHDGSTLGDLAAAGDHFLSPDGARALLVGDNGRLFRWEAGKASSRRVFDRRWIDKRKPKSVAFAPDGRIAVVYEEFETDFLTIIPLDHAWEAPSWPTHRIVAEMREAAMEIHVTPAGAAVADGGDEEEERLPAPVLRTIYGSRIVMELQKRIDSNWVTGLAEFDIEKKKTRWLIVPKRFVSSHAMSDARLLGVDIDADYAECMPATGASAFVSTPSSDIDAYDRSCMATFDVARGQFSSLWPIPYSGVLRADPHTAQAESVSWLKGYRSPDMLVGATRPNANRTAIPIVEWWTSLANELSREFGEDIWTSTRFSVTAGPENSLRIAGLKDSELLVTNISRGQPAHDNLGRRLGIERIRINADTARKELASISIDGSATLAVGFAGADWFVNELRETGRWTPLRKWDAGLTCAYATGRLATKSRLDQAVSSVRAASGADSRFLVLLADKTVATFAVRKETERSAPRARAECLPIRADAIVHVDLDRSLALVRDDAKGELIAIRIGDYAGDSAVVGIFKADAKQTAFFGESQLAILDEDGSIRLLAPGGGAGEIELPPVLPSAERIIAGPRSLLLLRNERLPGSPEDGNPVLWASAVILRIGKSADHSSVSHAGFLALPPDDNAFVRLADGDGLIEYFSGSKFLRVRLPRALEPGQLVDAMEAAGSAENSGTFKEGELVGLAATALAAGRTDEAVWGNDYRVCATKLEAAIANFENGNMSQADANGTAEDACKTWEAADPAIPAMRALLSEEGEGLFSETEPWPMAASKVLAAAADGNITAFGALLAWARNRAPSDSLLYAGAQAMLESYFSDPWTDGAADRLPAQFMAAVTAAKAVADPYVHRNLAHGYSLGDGGDPVQAFRHYWLAERLFREASEAWQADAAQRRRMALAASLPDDAIAAENRYVLAWKPEPPPASILPAMAASVAERLSQDAARLDALAAKTGQSAALDLVALHLLSLAEERSTGAARDDLRQRIAGKLLSRRDWPAMRGDQPSALATLFDRTAAFFLSGESLHLALRLRTIEFLESSDPVIDFTQTDEQAPAQIYQRALVDTVAAGADKLAPLAKGFSLGHRAFTFNSTGLSDAVQSKFLRSALEDRKRLAESIEDANSASVTRFWLGYALSQASSDGASPTEAGERKREYISLYRTTADGLRSELGKVSPDDQAIRSEAAASYVDWARTTSVPADELLQFESNESGFDSLAALVERGDWSPAWANDFLAAQMNLLEHLGLAAVVKTDEIAFQLPAGGELRLRMTALRLAQHWSSLVLRGGANADNDKDINLGYFSSGPFAIAFAARRTVLEGIALPVATPCENAVSSPYDPARRAPGKIFDAGAMTKAIGLCREAIKLAPDDPALRFALGRALAEDNGREAMEEKLDNLIASPREEYAVSFNNLSAEAEGLGNETVELELANAYSQRIFRDHWSNAFRGLSAVAQSEEDRQALRWMIERAADLGSVEANLRIARDAATDPVERRFRIGVAKKLNASVSFQLDVLAAIAPIDPAEQRLVNKRVQAWEKEKWIELPAYLKETLLGTSLTR